MAERPPRDITPTRFFEEWLPTQPAARTALSPMTVRVRLDGDDGGVWDLRMGADGLAVSPAQVDGPAEVTIHQSVKDWRAIAIGEPGGVDLAPPQASATDILFLDKNAQAMVSAVRGTVRFEVTGYNDRTWSLTVKFGPGDPATSPDATISVDAETYGQMLARTLPPPQAYFSGKIKLLGDVNLAMQLGMAMMPRFT